jgi:hypothetical protein
MNIATQTAIEDRFQVNKPINEPMPLAIWTVTRLDPTVLGKMNPRNEYSKYKGTRTTEIDSSSAPKTMGNEIKIPINTAIDYSNPV